MTYQKKDDILSTFRFTIRLIGSFLVGFFGAQMMFSENYLLNGIFLGIGILLILLTIILIPLQNKYSDVAFKEYLKKCKED